ncbi:MAG: hypothetical protein EPN85_01660 [Bacteroidetes bacterium]|nr:MAG: hypothetical protein EPN85_01660 [Bacteroidota bacterium]
MYLFFPDDHSHVNHYDYDSSWTGFLNTTALSNSFICEEDIEIYDWKEQQIYLNESGNQKFIELKEKIEKQKSTILQFVKFIVVFKKQRMYAGTFNHLMSAAAISHPVIYYDYHDYPLKKENAKMIFTIRPIGLGGIWGSEQQNKVILNENIRNHFLKLHKLKLG